MYFKYKLIHFTNGKKKLILIFCDDDYSITQQNQMNHYYDLPTDIINKIDEMAVVARVKQMVDDAEANLAKWAFDDWRKKMNKVNCVFNFCCMRGGMVEKVEDEWPWFARRDAMGVGDFLWDEDGEDEDGDELENPDAEDYVRAVFKEMEEQYWNSPYEHWRNDFWDNYEPCVVTKIS